MFWTCFEVFCFAKKRPVHPGASRLGKISENWKDSELLKHVQKRSQKHFLSMFWLNFSTEKSSAQWTLETQKNPQKAKNFQTFKNVQKWFQVCPNLFWSDFLEVFFSVHPGGSRGRKIPKNGKKFKFSKSRKLSKNVQFFWGVFFSKFLMTSAPWRSKRVKIREKNSKNLKFQKCPKTFLKVSKQVVELVLRWLSWKNMPSAPWRVETW